MAKNDVKIVNMGGRTTIPTHEYATEAAGTAINPGEPVKRGGTGGNYVVPLADGDPEISADLIVGIAAKASTHTASADGVVEVFEALPGVVYRCDATTAGNVAAGIRYDRVAFDLSGGVYTVDENEGDDADHGLVIVDIDTDEGTVDFEIRSCGTLRGNVTV